jgi:hypothetical protein
MGIGVGVCLKPYWLLGVSLAWFLRGPRSLAPNLRSSSQPTTTASPAPCTATLGAHTYVDFLLFLVISLLQIAFLIASTVVVLWHVKVSTLSGVLVFRSRYATPVAARLNKLALLGPNLLHSCDQGPQFAPLDQTRRTCSRKLQEHCLHH